MDLIFNNQISIFEDILYKYLTPKQCTKLYTSNIILYNIFVDNNKFESNYYTPKTNRKLKEAVNIWYDNRKYAILKYGHISYWNTKYIINMYSLFQDKDNFNDNISDWNTSNISSMANMFYNATNFNQNLNNWNMINISDMGFMFYNARNFNQDLNNWNLLSIRHIGYMFKNAINLNKSNYINWNMSNYYKVNSHIEDYNNMLY